jgi:hypothetical protein
MLLINVGAIEIGGGGFHGFCSHVTRSKSTSISSQNAVSSRPEENSIPSTRNLTVGAAALSFSTRILTESALKEGNYVQGTICLVLRKCLGDLNARCMEIEAEIEDAVREKLDRLTALDEAWTAETLYTDGDLTLAAYAAALQVVTSYSNIDRQPLDRDLYRQLKKGEQTMIRDLVDYAAEVANNLLVPEKFPRDMWCDLLPSERFCRARIRQIRSSSVWLSFGVCAVGNWLKIARRSAAMASISASVRSCQSATRAIDS